MHNKGNFWRVLIYGESNVDNNRFKKNVGNNNNVYSRILQKMRYEKEVFVINNFTLSSKKKRGDRRKDKN